MKKHITLVLLLFTFAVSAGNTRSAFAQFIVTNASTSAPAQIVSTNLWVTSVTLIGKKAARTDNTGIVYIGTTSTDNEQPYPVAAGGFVTILAFPGTEFNLKDWYFDPATADDGLVIIYQ